MKKRTLDDLHRVYNSSSFLIKSEGSFSYIFSIKREEVEKLIKLLSVNSFFRGAEVYLGQRRVEVIEKNELIKSICEVSSGETFWSQRLYLYLPEEKEMSVFIFNDVYKIDFIKLEYEINVTLSFHINLFTNHILGGSGELINIYPAARKNREWFNDFLKEIYLLLRPFRVEIEEDVEMGLMVTGMGDDFDLKYKN